MLAAVAAACSHSRTDSCEQTDEARMHEYVIEGKVHYLDGEYNDALDVLYKYLELSSKTGNGGNVDDIINAYIMLGNIHLAFSDYVRAYSYYEEGLRRSREMQSLENEVTFLNDLTIVSCYLDNRDQAMKYNEALADVKSKNPGLQRYLYLYLIGGAYIEKSFGSPAKAIDKMRSAISYIDRENLDPGLKLSALSELSEYFEENNMLDSALTYLDTFERLAIESNSPALLADNKRRYMRVYTKLGDTQNALRYQEEYFIHQDSVLNPNRFINVSNRFQKESEERTGVVVQNLRKTVASQKLLIIVILFSTVILLLWLFFRHKERVANVQLFKRNRELAQIEEKVRKIEEEKMSALPPQADITAVPEETDRDSGDDAMPRMRELYDKILAVMAQPDHYCDPKFSLNRLAELTGSNTKYVSQSINDCTGKNFRTFINEYRIREARRRLLDTENFGNVTIQFLAESVGFMSTSAFNMAFKKFTGMTPSLYQKMGRDEALD